MKPQVYYNIYTEHIAIVYHVYKNYAEYERGYGVENTWDWDKLLGEVYIHIGEL